MSIWLIILYISLAGAVGGVVGALMGALLVGAAGAKWFTTEIDKETWQATAVKATARPADDAKSKAVSMATPLEAINLVK